VLLPQPFELGFEFAFFLCVHRLPLRRIRPCGP
jgi:hypothetical protein